MTSGFNENQLLFVYFAVFAVLKNAIQSAPAG